MAPVGGFETGVMYILWLSQVDGCGLAVCEVFWLLQVDGASIGVCTSFVQRQFGLLQKTIEY